MDGRVQDAASEVERAKGAKWREAGAVCGWDWVKWAYMRAYGRRMERIGVPPPSWCSCGGSLFCCGGYGSTPAIIPFCCYLRSPFPYSDSASTWQPLPSPAMSGPPPGATGYVALALTSLAHLHYRGHLPPTPTHIRPRQQPLGGGVSRRGTRHA